MTASADSFRDRLDWDAATGSIMDQSRRYMMVRPEALMGIFQRLPAEARAEALEAFAASVTEQGADSARAYVKLGLGSGTDLAYTIARTAPQLGWGLWTMHVAADRITLEVVNSPFAAGFGTSETPVCHPIRGMLEAVAGMVFGAPAEAREVACAAMGAACCRFEAHRRSSG